ncbi:MAG: glycosyltransferase [Bacilli bacterium]|nr:glycosyltransferase [Bacilli bacterium]
MNKRLKIGIFMDSYYPAIDGVVLVIDNLCKELSKFNDVVLVVPYTNTIDEDKNKPYKIIRVKSIDVPFTEYRLGIPSLKKSKIYNELLKEKFDVIHIHSPFTIGKLGVDLAKDLNVPSVCTMHTRFDFEIRKVVKSESINKFVIKRIISVFNKCYAGIAINSKMIKVFEDYGYKKKPRIIYNGTDLKPLKENSKYIDIINEKYNIEANDKVLLFVGRITSVKNIFFILDSLKLLKEDGYQFKMFFVGSGSDEKKLALKILEYNLQDSVIMTGQIKNREELSAMYKRADLFLFPSLFDASSLVQIEAAVNETPGLFIEDSVTADTVTNEVSGFTSVLDEVKYKDRIKEILDDKKHLKEVSINAHKLLGKSWDEISKTTYEYYLELIENFKKEFGEPKK